MNPYSLTQHTLRAFLGRTSQGLGAVALASLLKPASLHAASRGTLQSLPLPQKAKLVIWLTMAGGPSQLELFDYKPKLAEMDGKPMPESMTKGQQLAQLQGQKLICKGAQFRFQKFGRNQTELSELLPHLGSVVDDICIVKSMTTDAINHDPAMSMWLAGAGVQRGLVYGSTDELGYAAMENVCTVHDLHATMLHQLGIQHNAFTFKFQGLDAKLTGVEGAKTINNILA